MTGIGAVIVAAGRGTRAGGAMPKQWYTLAGRTVVHHATARFLDHAQVGPVVIVLHEDDLAADLWPGLPGVEVVTGGATRSASVLAGLRVLEGRVRHVLIHDGARPCVSADIISAVIDALQAHPAAAPAIPVVDALWTGAEGRVTGTADRTGLFRAQTPQGFALDAILAAHETAQDPAADDVEIARRAGLEVVITPGSEDNLKITTPEDFARAEAVMRARNGH